MATFLSCAFIFFFLCLSVISPAGAQTGGFSVELIHRDSPKSPFYNPNETPYQRLRNALNRSANRLSHFNKNSSVSSSKVSQADIIPNGGDYLIRISIGTPPVEILAVADTGSDLIWTQCQPCPPSQCYKQDNPLFDPQKSSTYKYLSCSSSQCAPPIKDSCSAEGNCKYSVRYGDQESFSKGDLATETVTLGSTSGQAVALPEIVFGCGTKNDGKFNSKTDGIVGLGGGDASLISQIRTTIAGDQRLGVISGSTPGGDIVIDSGTTLTYLPPAYASTLLSVMSSMIAAQPVEGPSDLCYRISSRPQFPEVTIHFRDADVKLSPSNFFMKISEDLVCSVFSASNGTPIYGNIMQTNFLIGYDIEGRTVSFKPTDCSKQ
ncbi:Aspartic proteinase CDR1 [Citrus sinensis]|uniref:Aspartic proteinase CDR1 n=1 Tax=Citrus sinensis TaxID=2711 RepID=A0ACB8M750_CITSI|nr:Aspartic proteinase CDR1 [Citrus sinensis]